MLLSSLSCHSDTTLYRMPCSMLRSCSDVSVTPGSGQSAPCLPTVNIPWQHHRPSSCLCSSLPAVLDDNACLILSGKDVHGQPSPVGHMMSTLNVMLFWNLSSFEIVHVLCLSDGPASAAFFASYELFQRFLRGPERLVESPWIEIIKFSTFWCNCSVKTLILTFISQMTLRIVKLTF